MYALFLLVKLIGIPDLWTDLWFIYDLDQFLCVSFHKCLISNYMIHVHVHVFLKLTCEGQTTTSLKSCSDSGLKAPHLFRVKGWSAFLSVPKDLQYMYMYVHSTCNSLLLFTCFIKTFLLSSNAFIILALGNSEYHIRDLEDS